MAEQYRLDVKDNIYKLGDLNLMFENKQALDYPPIDPEHPEKPFFTGVLRYEVTVGERTRPFLIYIPQNYPISGAGLFLYPDDGVSCEACLEDGWRTLSEQTNTALIILQAGEGGWSKKDIQSEVSYSEAVFKRSIARTHFSMNEATYYIMGLGAGAYAATAYGLLSSSLFSCILADGDFHLDSRLMEQLGAIRSDRDSACSKLEVVMPAWLADRTGEDGGDVLASLKRASVTEDRGLSDGYAAVFQQDPRRYLNGLDGLPISEVRYTGAEAASALPAAELHRQMLLFALRFKRWLGIGNGSFRAARTAEEMGLKRFTAHIDGRSREWYVYEPAAYRKDPAQKRPVLLAIHGYSCTGALFAENSGWHELAERRGFFVVYVSAYPSNANFQGCTVPLPTWNAVGMEAETDDIKYIDMVMADVESRYPTDPERLYVTGHSNGSLMTQTLLKERARKFAAFAPQGAQYHMALNSPSGVDTSRDIQADGILRPVWLMMGSEDIGTAQDRIEPGNANDLFLEMMCRLNCVDRSHEQCLENGKYTTRTYASADGVPLVRFTGIQDTPHCFSPEMAEMYWDQFLCHFRRTADGSIIYTM